jgi:hypothetical protein
VLTIFIAVEWRGASPTTSSLCLTMDPTSQRTRLESNTISRHQAVSKQAPKRDTTKKFTFWRRKTRSRKPKHVLTVGDRLLQAKKREQHRREYQDALEQAQATLQELAEGLRSRFGKYSFDHYFNDLIHQAHTSRSVRKVSAWNAYQKLELERMKCKCFGCIFLWSYLTCTLHR